MSVAALVLAAGASSRMGEPKPLVPWGDRPLVAWVVAELLRAPEVADVTVVLGRHAEAVRAALHTLRALPDPTGAAVTTVFHPRWPQGRATSLAAGARAIRRRGGDPPPFVLVLNVDQPVGHPVVSALVAALAAAPDADAAQPLHDGVRAHPVLLRGALLDELCAVTEATHGLRAVLARHPAVAVPLPDHPEVRLDLDTPAALAAARARFAPPAG